jgi:hypothetical protein
MRTSGAASTKPGTSSTYYAQSGDPQPYSNTRSSSLTPMWSQSCFTALRHDTTKTNSHKQQTFINRCLRNILNIIWSEVISNQISYRKLGKSSSSKRSRKGNWNGLAIRCESQRLTSPGSASSGTSRESVKWADQDIPGGGVWTLKPGWQNDMSRAEEGVREPSKLEECGLRSKEI